MFVGEIVRKIEIMKLKTAFYNRNGRVELSSKSFQISITRLLCPIFE